MNRLLIYVHFNKYGQLSNHIKYQLEKLKSLFSKTVFITNSPLSDLDKEIIQEKCDIFIQRANEGFDFAAWREGMAYIGFETLIDYDSVTLMNDTCFGPLWDLQPVFEKFETDKSVDFWGMTNHRQTLTVKEHLQSYFLSFKKSVLESGVFLEFWQQVENHSDIQSVIDLFETRLTCLLVEEGFRYGAVFDTLGASDKDMLHPDFSFYNPTEILNQRVPFLKVKAIEGNQNTAAFILDHVSRVSDYPVELIRNHMGMMFLPTRKYLLKDKYGILGTSDYVTPKKVAIHLHVFYTDLLSDFIAIFRTYPFDYDLLITTDSEAKVPTIEAYLQSVEQEAVITVTGNRGRDVLPMLKLKNQLSQYDYIGHFHTKKSKEANFWAGESWRQELIDMLVKPASTILERLDSDENLGLVIADIPTYFRYVQLVPHYENSLSEEMNALWKQMALVKDIDFSTYYNYVMSYGTYVWFKYDALKPLFDLDLTDEQVPKEPLPQKSILHAIERLLVYVAWSQNYDFYISQNNVQLPAFVEVEALTKVTTSLFTTPDFTYFGGLKGALSYFVLTNKAVFRYIIKRLLGRRW